MEKFEVYSMKFTPESLMGKISVVCKTCEHESEKILIGNINAMKMKCEILLPY